VARAIETLRAAVIAARNLALGTNVAGLALGSPRRMVHYASESLFMRRALTQSRGLPERNVWDALGAQRATTIRLADIDNESWPAAQPSYLADIVNLCRICAALQPSTIFEIGTYRGYSTLHFALNAGANATVFSLDLPKDGNATAALRTTIIDDAHIAGATGTRAYVFNGYDEAQRIQLLFGDSGTFDYTPYHNRIDVFFIDGAHSYEYVKSDTMHALACTRPGGVIAWHDFGRVGINGVSRCLLELRASGWPVLAAPGGSLAYMVMPARQPS
jgi:hypothetical protein